jgi:vancomycin permeability regulator SanA
MRFCADLLFGRFGFGGVAFRVFAAEAFYAAGGVHELLLAGKEGMAGGADFNADIALMRRARYKCVPAGAMNADLAVVRMDSCFHVNSTSIQTFDSIGRGKDSARRGGS